MEKKDDLIKKAKHTENFTIVGNGLIRDSRMSIEARGILIYLISLPTDWVIRKTDLQKKLNISRRAVDSCFEEIKKAGYMVEADLVKKDGRFDSKGYIVYNHSLLDEPPAMYVTDAHGEQQNDSTVAHSEQRTVAHSEQLQSTIGKRTNTESKTSLLLQKIEKKKEWLRNELEPYLEKYGRAMLNDFYSYWTESNADGTRIRIEKEKFFDVSKRLVTWHSRSVTKNPSAAPRPSVPASESPMANQDNHSNYADYVAWCERNNITPKPDKYASDSYLF